ncbi:hypothetical protein TW86_13395 [Halomonas sp. S2151]|uniref:hypothetical protein n=1 Tax=Halomonas sp. S2151 TaxID=579478 RepID=UPI0005F9F6CC|nr:hypothetical protein [Halomonas sp. S2151]KJZ11103.1 hypothetical protein TW86_13395 [Halomonas sp. S2151]
MSKPIEPGCLVMVTHHKYFGFSATALRRYSEGDIFRTGYKFSSDSWELSASPEGGKLPLCPERFLMRIDGDDHVTTEEREDEEVSA